MDKKMKKKSLCKWTREDLKENWPEMFTLVGKPKFICERCLRSARLKGNLCKPEKLPKPA